MTPLPCLLLVSLLASGLGGPPSSAPPPGVPARLWERSATEESVEALVLLRERADLPPATCGLGGRVERRRAVVTALRETAARSQGGLLARLDQLGVPHRRFAIVNAVWLRADSALLAEIAARPEVERIVENPRIRLEPERPGGVQPKAAVPWGVERIGAPELWALGHDGSGIVVGGQDTGVRWTHEALRDHYRGWDGAAADHDFNWHDSIHLAPDNPCGEDSVAPCDDAGHGTHTLGTAAGGTADESVGVAPGARWIACRNMDEGNGTPASYLECFEWLLAPWAFGADPATGDPALGADVTVNSWLCPPSEGCDWEVLQGAVDAHRAAGIFTAASAGNSGPGCGSINNPPGLYAGSVSVGASDSGERLAGFSSRGPVPQTGDLKPDVSAPGVGVRSATGGADDGYDAWSGTSMAAPHVAGAVALLWSAIPALAGDVDATEALLEQTAFRLWNTPGTCGGDADFGPNASWGHGRIDVARAFAYWGAPPTELACDDGFDEDGDGFADCADPDCAGLAGCLEAGRCADRVDNDLDGDRDCLDSECLGDASCPEAANCLDGLDNDLDGTVDCADSDCDVVVGCPAVTASAVLDLTNPVPDPALASLFDGACRLPKWRSCPALVLPGALPLVLPGELAPTGGSSLRLYEHSDNRGDLLLEKSGSDLVLRIP